MNATPSIKTNANPVPDRILGGLAYLRQVLDEALPFAVVVASDAADRSRLVRRFLAAWPGQNLAHVAGPVQDPYEFLQSLLVQLGFEPFESSVTELQSLLTVFAQHEGAQGRRPLIVVEELQLCGPRVLAVIEALAEAGAPGQVALSFVVTGDDALNRVLDSAGMLRVSSLTRRRYVMDDAPAAAPDPEPAATPLRDTTPQLIVSLDGTVVSRHGLERPQLTIGRNEHNDVCIVSRYVSRHHALLVNRPDGAYIVDLKSTNGTLVNSTAISQHALKHGDVVSIGNFRLKYHNPAVQEATGLQGLEPASFAETSVMRSGQWSRPDLELVRLPSDTQAGG